MQITDAEIKRYLFGEMSEDERAEIENEFFADDDLFVQIGETENRLVDEYASGKLSGDELARFERSLEKFPERRAKIANSAALKTYIAAEKTPSEIREETPSAPITQSFWSKITEFFNVKSPAFNLAAIGFLILFAAASVLLLIDNQRKSSELAALRNASHGDGQKRQKELEDQLAAAGERVGELQKLNEDQIKTADGLVGDLANAREEKERLEREFARLQKTRGNAATPTPKQPNAPTIASFLLIPSAKNSARNLSVKNEIERVSMQIVLPEEIKSDEQFSVKLNEKTIADALTPSVSANGQKSLRVTFPANALNEGANKLTVVSRAGAQITEYIFNSQKK